MKKIVTSIILIVVIAMVPIGSVYATSYSSDGIWVENTVEQLNEYLKLEGYPDEYIPEKVGIYEITWETENKNIVTITKAKDENGEYYVVEVNSMDLISYGYKEGYVKLGQYDTADGGVRRSVDPITSLEQAQTRVKEIFAGHQGMAVFGWGNSLIEGTNTFRWQKKAKINIKSLGENGKATFDMDVYTENAIDLIQEQKYNSVEAPNESNSTSINDVRYVRAEGTYKYEYDSDTKQIKKAGTYSGGHELAIKNKFSWNGEEWCSLQYSTGYVKASDLQTTKPTQEQIDNAQKIGTPSNIKNSDEDTSVYDYVTFEQGSGGVIIGNLPSSSIADPTNESLVNEYNPYTSSSALTDTNSSKLLSLGKTVIGILNVIATVVAILVLITLGIKYMMGSIEEKAEYKETMMPYIIGAIFIFSSTTIVNLIYNFAVSFNK